MAEDPATAPTTDAPCDAAPAAPRPRRRGRRPAGENTRETIVTAARTLFLAQGYDRVSMRAIARQADVDPALVHHYFDGKPELFATSVIAPGLNPARFIDGLAQVPTDQLGRAIVFTFLRVWDGEATRGAFRSLMQVAMSPDQGARPLREFVVAEVLARLPLVCDDRSEAERRRQLIASQLLGMALARYVVALPTFEQATPDELADLVGPGIQRCVDGG